MFVAVHVHVLIPDDSARAVVNIGVGQYAFDCITSTRCSPAVLEL